MNCFFLKSKLVQVVFLVCASLGTIGFAYGGSKTLWDIMPEHLRSNTGVTKKDDMIYATSKVQVDNIRPDKAFEIARKNALLRASQMIHLFGSCAPEKFKLSDNDYQDFLSIMGPTVSQSHIGGLQVVRQWDTDNTAYTAIAVPAKALARQVCPYSSLDQVIEQYLSLGNATFDGLIFCLKHSLRYTTTYQESLTKVGQWFRQNKLGQIAPCFDGRFLKKVEGDAIADIAAENRIYRAERLVEEARSLMEKGQADGAMVYATAALELVPSYGPAFLVTADYLHQLGNESALVMPAIKTALRSGTVYKEALKKLVGCMKLNADPETQIFKYLLDHSKPISDGKFHSWADNAPDGWISEFHRFKDDPLLNLVVVSLGNVITGPSMPPAGEFQIAVDRFNRSQNSADIECVINLLITACHNQPASAETYNLLGACFRNLQKYELALPFFWQALNLKSEYDLSLVNLGLCCYALNLEQSARYYFEHQSVVDSSNEWVRSSYEKFKTSLSKK